MICPKGRHTRSRTGKRRAQSWKINKATLVNCPSCNELAMPHKVCKKCGNYKKVEVIKKQD